MTGTERTLPADASDPKPRYTCFVDGCPGDHVSKWQICPELAGHDPDIGPDGRCRVCGEYESE